jgi:hypothetical protein
MTINIRFFIATIIILSISSMKLHAQERPFGLGIKAGFNFPLFNAVKPPEIDRLQNDGWFYVGLQSQIRLSKKFSLQPEAFWMRSGVQEYFSNPYGISDEQISQLAIPILAKYHLGKVSLYGGLQANILLKVNQWGYDAIQEEHKYVDYTDSSYKKMSWGGVVGIEWVFKYRFGIDARYIVGLSNLRASNGTSHLTYADNQNLKISCFQTGLFFRFGKKPKS